MYNNKKLTGKLYNPSPLSFNSSWAVKLNQRECLTWKLTGWRDDNAEPQIKLIQTSTKLQIKGGDLTA